MKTGICTTDFKTMPCEQLFSRIAEIGFETVQLAFASVAECGYTPDESIEIPESVDPAVVKLIRETAGRYGLEISAVNGTFNMTHPDKVVRDEGIRRWRGFVEAVNGLGVKYISLCSGTRSRVSLWSYHPDNMNEDAWSDMIATVSACTAIAAEYGITLAVETEVANVINTPERARRMMDEVNSPYLKMVMDCANLFHPGQAKVENSADIIRHAFDAFGSDVVIAHGKDINAGDGIEFCATGRGIVDFGVFIEQLDKYGYKGDMLLHGIYDEEDMPRALAFFRQQLNIYNDFVKPKK